MITASMVLNKEALHQAVIKHWKANEDKYSSFTKIEKFDQEINLFERDNSISQTLSCTLPLVIANVLQTPAVILTDMPHIPIIPLCPDNYFSEKNMFWILHSKGTFQFAFRKNINAMEKTKTFSLSSPSDNKNKLCRCGQGAKRKLKDVVSCLEYKSKCPCLQAVKSCSNSCGCIGCENPFGKNQGADPPDISSVKRLRRKHSLTTEAGMKYLQIDHKKAHWSIIEELLLEEIANSLSQKDIFDITNLLSLYNHTAESALHEKLYFLSPGIS